MSNKVFKREKWASLYLGIILITVQAMDQSEVGVDKLIEKGSGSQLIDGLKNSTAPAPRRSMLGRGPIGGSDQYETEASTSYEEEEDDDHQAGSDARPLIHPAYAPASINPHSQYRPEHYYSYQGNSQNYRPPGQPPGYATPPKQGITYPPGYPPQPQNPYMQARQPAYPSHGSHNYPTNQNHHQYGATKHKGSQQDISSTNNLTNDLNTLNKKIGSDDRNRSSQYESVSQRVIRAENDVPKKNGKKRRILTKWVPVQYSVEYDDSFGRTTPDPRKPKKKIIKYVPIELSVEDGGRSPNPTQLNAKPKTKKTGAGSTEDGDDDRPRKKGKKNDDEEDIPNDRKRKQGHEEAKDQEDVELSKMKRKTRIGAADSFQAREVGGIDEEMLKLPKAEKPLSKEDDDVEDDDTSGDDEEDDGEDDPNKNIIKLISVEVSDEDGEKSKNYAYGKKKKTEKGGKKKGWKGGKKVKKRGKKGKKGGKVDKGAMRLSTKKPKTTTSKTKQNDNNNNNWNLLGLIPGG